MPKKATNLPVRVLKIWFDIVLVIGVAACAVFLGWLALSPFLMSRGDMPTDAAIQVVVGDRSWFPVYAIEFEPTDKGIGPGIERASLVRARGELRFLTTSWQLHVTTVGGIMLGSLIILYVIWALRRVLINVLADRPFDAANGHYLRRSGYIVLILGAVWPALDYALSSYVMSKIEVSNIDLSPAINLDKDVFVVGLLFLVFGAILTRGHQLQEREQALEEEQALTV